MVIRIVTMVRVVVGLQSARPMVVVLRISGMAVNDSMGVLVGMLMQVFVDDLSVPMRMGMQMAVGVMVLMFVLQGSDGVAAPLPEGKGEPVEISETPILQERFGR